MIIIINTLLINMGNKLVDRLPPYYLVDGLLEVIQKPGLIQFLMRERTSNRRECELLHCLGRGEEKRESEKKDKEQKVRDMFGMRDKTGKDKMRGWVNVSALNESRKPWNLIWSIHLTALTHFSKFLSEKVGITIKNIFFTFRELVSYSLQTDLNLLVTVTGWTFTVVIFTDDIYKTRCCQKVNFAQLCMHYQLHRI